MPGRQVQGITVAATLPVLAELPRRPKPIKRHPFISNYKRNFEVVEEHRGNTWLYPHTEQLPILLRALNNEFEIALPGGLARLDHRGNDYDRIALWLNSMSFCTVINATRSDQIALFPLPSSALLTKVSIAQYITEHTPLGSCHRFRFYSGPQNYDEIYLSGRRIAFSEHAIQRYCQRVPLNRGEELTAFLVSVFTSPIVAMCVNGRDAFVVPHMDSILALAYRETETEFFVTTCLTKDEIYSLQPEATARAFNFHYGKAFTPPAVRNWNPPLSIQGLHASWLNNVPIPPPIPLRRSRRWFQMASEVYDIMGFCGYSPGSSLRFHDNIPGPLLHIIPPGVAEPKYAVTGTIA